jgi:hypothetical protein
LRECVDSGLITEDFLQEQMRHNHIRHDAFDLIRQAPTPQMSQAAE